jgi:hypothetical protein
MTVSDLCARAEITRQWLNKLVDRGEVPGCVRDEDSGRLSISDSSKLAKWIANKARLQTKKQGRRLSLEERRERYERLPGLEAFTATELAERTGLGASTIRRRVVDIPDAYADGASYRFKRTPELEQWISETREQLLFEREQRHRLQLALKKNRVPKPERLKAGKRVNDTRVALVRLFKHEPLRSWDAFDLRMILEDLRAIDRLADQVEAELKSRKQSRVR